MNEELCRVIIIDDSPEDRAEVRQLLLQGSNRRYTFEEAETAAAGVRAVRSGNLPDLIILDYSLPDMEAPDVLALLTGRDELPVCPVLVLTGWSTEENSRAVLRGGAQDFLGKNWMTSESLTHGVESAMERFQLTRQLRESRRFLHQVASITPGVLYVFDLEKQCTVFINRTVASVLGYNPDEVAAMGTEVVPTLMHSDDLPRFAVHMQRVRRLGHDEIAEFEHRMRDRSGAWHWFLSRDSVFERDADGAVRQLIGTAIEITERKAAEEVSAASAAEFRSLFEMAGVGNAEVEVPSGRFVRVNRRFCELVGYAADELVGKMTFLDITHPDDVERNLTAVTPLMQNREGHFEIEKRYIRKDGSTVWVHLTGTLMRARDGQATRLLGSVTDITERKRMEALLDVRALQQREREGRLRTSEENYRLLVEGATGFAIIRLDFGGRVSMWNVGAARILGYDEAEVIGEHFSRFFTPEDLAAGKPERELAQARAKEKGDDDNWLVRKDGTRFWASGATTALRDEAGELMGYAKIVRDMTERRQTLEAQRESDERFRTLADNIPQLAWIADAGSEGQVHWFNRRWFDYTGTTLEEMKGSGWKSVHHPEYVERVVQKFEHHVKHCLDWEDTFPLRGKDGQYCWFLSRMKVIRDESGAAVRMFGTNTDITQERHMANALRESEERYRAIFDSAPVGIAHIGLDGRWVLLNDAACTITGYTRDTLTTRTVADITHPEDIEAGWAQMRRVHAGEISRYSMEKRYVREDRSIVWVHLTVSLLRDAEGQPINFISVIQDISERKRAEVALQQNASLLSRLVDQAPIGTYVVDAEFRLQQVNALAAPAFSRVHPLIGRDFSDVITILWGTKLGSQIVGIFRHTLETGERYISPPFVEQREDLSTEQAYDWEVQRITLADGQYGVVCYFHEVTELQQAERALRENEARMRLATEATAVGIWEWNILTNRIWWDPHMFRIYGIASTPDGVVDYSDWKEAVLPEDLPPSEEILQDTMRRGGTNRRIFRILRRHDGVCCHIEAVETVRTNAQGQAEWMVGTNLDITERVQAQEHLRQLTGTLEAQVMERTQELATSYDRLRTLAIDLTVAEQTERRRLATELHDYLAQQLVVTRMKVSQALRQDCEPEVRKILKDTDQLLHQSLDYTRSLVSELTPQALYERGLGAALHWLADQMRRQQILNVEISSDAPEWPLPETESVLLFHSVRELLFNVLKHSHTDRAFVSIRHDQHVLSLTVSDHGSGFDVSKLRHDRSDRFGLLSIRERMLALGGRFDLQSEVGKGTTASLYLPLTVPDNRVETPVVGGDGSPPVQEALEAANQRTPRPVAAPPPHGEVHIVTLIRVLIVDDHQMVREGLCSILREHDDIAIVGEASTGEQALQLVGMLMPDVVIMDMNMPGWNGAESTRRILSAHPATIVIGLSIQTDPHVAESMLEAGVAAFLPKEASGEALYTTIQTAVGRS